MRKAQKQEIMNIINSLFQAHEEIKKAIEQKNQILAQNMLAECQDAAISIGEFVEKREGKEHSTVSCVEEYCEVLFQVHEELTIDLFYQNKKIDKRLRKQLIKVENSIKNDIISTKEVVFLPYKASMWDSLESVWKAADADENCDAYVIPIPYYDKNPDGTFKTMHYEADQFPEYVPIFSYKDYNFQIKNPDIIYIHNPYDEYNLVTSVPPFFFSSNLKKLTEKLVYIPYFVLDEIRPDEEKRIGGMKHFVTTPAVFNADKVIVQSENMRQVYIKVLLEYMKDYSEATRNYWENKISGLGSPKVDKVLGTQKDNLAIPKEWLKIIEKNDGSWKKIVFYNTSVGALLQYNEKMIKKMDFVFRVFKEIKDEVALLWRPHPLIRATVESMRPQLWIEYNKLVGKYCEQGWGIYDDSSDIDRAIILSDAYYGDASSVVQLYQQTRKPIMIQSVDCAQAKWNALYTTYKLVEGEGKVWFFAALFNGLFTVDLNNSEVEWRGKIPGEADEIRHLYRFYLMLGHKLYFAPTNAKNIAVYDILQEKYQTYTLNMEGYHKNGNYANVLRFQNDLVFIGVCRTNRVCRFCVKTGEIIDINTNILEQIEVGEYEELYGRESCIREEVLYIPLLKGGCALKLNLRTGIGELIKLVEEDVSFTMAIYMQGNDTIWFVGNAGFLIQWNEKDQTREVKKFADQINESYITYKLEQNKLYLFPVSRENKIRCIDLYTNKCIQTFQSSYRIVDTQKIDGIDYYLGDTIDGKCCAGYLAEGIENMIAFHRRDQKIGKICFDEYQIDFFNNHYSDYLTEMEDLYIEEDKYSYGRTLEIYLSWIRDNYKRSFWNGGSSMKIGKDIWNCI